MNPGQAKWYGKLHHRSAERRLAEALQHDGYMQSLLESIAVLEREVSKRYAEIGQDAKVHVVNDRVTVQMECTCAWRPTPDQDSVEIIQVDPACSLHGVHA